MNIELYYNFWTRITSFSSALAHSGKIIAYIFALCSRAVTFSCVFPRGVLTMPTDLFHRNLIAGVVLHVVTRVVSCYFSPGLEARASIRTRDLPTSLPRRC